MEAQIYPTYPWNKKHYDEFHAQPSRAVLGIDPGIHNMAMGLLDETHRLIGSSDDDIMAGVNVKRTTRQDLYYRLEMWTQKPHVVKMFSMASLIVLEQQMKGKLVAVETWLFAKARQLNKQVIVLPPIKYRRWFGISTGGYETNKKASVQLGAKVIQHYAPTMPWVSASAKKDDYLEAILLAEYGLCVHLLGESSRFAVPLKKRLASTTSKPLTKTESNKKLSNKKASSEQQPPSTSGEPPKKKARKDNNARGDTFDTRVRVRKPARNAPRAAASKGKRKPSGGAKGQERKVSAATLDKLGLKRKRPASKPSERGVLPGGGGVHAEQEQPGQPERGQGLQAPPEEDAKHKLPSDAKRAEPGGNKELPNAEQPRDGKHVGRRYKRRGDGKKPAG
jgi:hypothetical protein